MILIGRYRVVNNQNIIEFLVQFDECNVPITMPYMREAKKFNSEEDAEEVLKGMSNDFKIIEMWNKESKGKNIMQKEIKVVVGVTSEDHVEMIKADILRVVRQRTTIYFVSNPKDPDKYVEECIKEEHPELLWDTPKVEG